MNPRLSPENQDRTGVANSDLNPGDQHYHDLFNNNSSISDAEDNAANDYARDYSNPTDQSSPSRSGSRLRSAERSASVGSPSSHSSGIGGNGASKRDIGTQERTATTPPQWKVVDSKFNKSGNVVNKNGKQLGKFKQRLLVSGLVTLAGGGLLGALFGIVSGPMQLVQAAQLIKDFQLGPVNAQKAVRASRAINNILQLGNSNAVSDYVKNSRLGMLGRKQAANMEKRLDKLGVHFDSNMFGQRSGLTIDLAGKSENEIDSLLASLDLGDKAKVADGKLHISDNLSYGEARRTLTTLDDPGKGRLRSWMQTRATLKKNGFVSWLHPLQKAKAAAYKKLTDFIEDQAGSVMGNNSKTSRVQDGQEKNSDDYNEAKEQEANAADDGTEEGKKRGEEIRGEKTDSGSNRSAAGEFADKVKEKVGNRIGSKLRPVAEKLKGAIDAKNAVMSMAGVAIPLMILSVMCTVKDMSDQIGSYKMSAIVNVAENASAQIMGYGSQVQSGDDITMELAGKAVQMTMYDKVPVVDRDGKDTGKTQNMSFWSNETVCKTLGTAGCREDSSSVPDVLKNVGEGGFAFLPSPFKEMLDGILGTNGVLGQNSPLGSVFGGACLAINWVDNKISDITKPVTDAISSAIMKGLSGVGINAQDAIDRFASWAGQFLFGSVLDMTTANPKVWGAVSMYGGKFLSNDQSIGSGGRRLSSQQAINLNLENRRFLAWQNSQKPLLARLVDPSDYSSSINQLARAAEINTSSQDLATQIANVFKVALTAPRTIASATNQLVGGNAYAASTYDYGVPTFAWSTDEENSTLASANIYDNVDKVMPALEAEDATIPTLEKGTSFVGTKDSDAMTTLAARAAVPYHFYAYNCLSVKIDDVKSGAKVSILQNEDGTKWNYVDNGNNEWCQQNSSKYTSLRLYVMDYFNTVSGMCYEGSEDDSDSSAACEEMGVGGSGSSGNASASASPQDADALAAQFEKDTNNTGDVDNFAGRQCVDLSVWYVNTFTTLNHATCNGNCFVDAIITANPELKKVPKGQAPTAPAIFSTVDGIMGPHDPYHGHTGVVTSVDSDGTIHTIETGNDAGRVLQRTYEPSEYNGADFVNVGDYLK